MPRRSALFAGRRGVWLYTTTVHAAATPTLPLAVVELTWRRRDVQPQTKDILVAFRAANASGAAPLPIANRVVLSVNGSVGRILLDGSHGPGVYDVYYLPLVSNGAAFGRKDAFQPMRRNGSSSAVSPQAILPSLVIGGHISTDCL